MKLSLYLFFLLFSLFGFTQDKHYIVIYEQKKLATEFGFSIPSSVKTYLNGDGKNSVYFEDWINNNNSNTSDNNFSIKSEQNPTYFKNLNEKTITYSTEIRLKPFIVKDTDLNFDISVKSENKIILGYTCQKAIINHRGRNFTVYFAPEIPFSDGPWKFFGLPGLILEVSSQGDMGNIEIRATKINIREDKREIKNPFLDKKTISYSNFINIYNSKNEEMISQQTDNHTLSLSEGFMEVLLTKK